MLPVDVSDEGKQSRTLLTLRADHSAFVAAGSQLSVVTPRNSVIPVLILLVEISHTVAPVLHLDLGIHSWIYAASMLVEIRQLDKCLICTTPAASNGNSNGQYTALVTLHAKLQQCIAGAKAAKQKATRIEGWFGYSRSSARP